MHVYDKLDEAEDILKQMERCGSFSLRHSCSDRGSEEQQGRGRVEDDQEVFDLLIKLKRIQLLLRLVFDFCTFFFLTLCVWGTGAYDVYSSFSCSTGRMKVWRQKLETNFSHQTWKRTRPKMIALMLPQPC